MTSMGKQKKRKEKKHSISASSRALKMEYAIRNLVITANKYAEESGKEILRLNIGDPIKFDYETPFHMQEALGKATKQGYNYYANSKGLKELREAIIKREKRDNDISLGLDDIRVTNGVSEAIRATFIGAFEANDEILIPGPVYPPYSAFSRLLGVKAIEYECIEEEGWKPNIVDIREKITDDTKALLIVNPNNPTGAVYPKETIKRIIDIAGEHDMFLLSDEIYDKILYDREEAPNTASLSENVPVITFYGLSKVYLAPGWRIGYMYKKDPENRLKNVWEGILKTLLVRLSSNTPSQKAAVKALLGKQDHIKEVVEKSKKRRDFVYRRLKEIPDIDAQKPQGAFYIFPRIENEKYKNKDQKFVLDLMKEKQVLFVNGSGFGEHGKNHFRIVFLPPLQILRKAMNRLEDFMKEKK